MSVYKLSIDRIRQHPGYLSEKSFEERFPLQESPDSMVDFIRGQGCLITVRHDLNRRYGGRDFLINVFSEIVVLHVSSKGRYSLHDWERRSPCSKANQISQERQAELMRQLFRKLA